jgi:hypothetical protein
MILLSFLILVGSLAAALFWLFRRPSTARTSWRLVLLLGLGIGIARASLACFGWYVVEHTGGPAQIPAFLLAMLSWPEAVLLPRRAPGPTPASTYVALFLLLVVSSVLLVSAIAAAARIGRSR